MATTKYLVFAAAVSTTCLLNAELAPSNFGTGGFGADVKALFEQEGALTGTIEDFSGTAGTRFFSLAGAPGVSFESNITTSGSPTSGLPVVGSFFANRNGQIVGTPFASGTDDGRMGYEVTFSSPQQYAGIQRYWNDQTLTQFYNASDVLLFELTGQTNPFVGYTGDPSDTSTWVSRIQMDTVAPSNNRQVGYSDDLIYGSSTFVIPEPRTYALSVAGLALLTVSIVRRRR